PTCPLPSFPTRRSSDLAAEIAGEARELAALALEGLATPHELAVELIGLPADYVQLLLEESYLAAQVLAALLERRGLPDLGQHQQEDHGAETAADRVQEREREYFEAAAPAHYGQSLDGMSSAPSVTRERCQKRCAACRSPCMGSSTLSIGPCSGSCDSASSKRRIRSAEFT